jgi:hypothetical protein
MAKTETNRQNQTPYANQLPEISLQIKGVYELSVKVLGKRVTHPFRVIKQLQEPVIIWSRLYEQTSPGL